MDEKDDLLGGGGNVAARLSTGFDQKRPRHESLDTRTHLYQSFSPVIVLVQMLSKFFKRHGDSTRQHLDDMRHVT